MKKLEYLRQINSFKSLSETIRKLIEKEYRKEKMDEETQKYNAYQDEMSGVEAQAMMEGYENPFY